jgi:hypothetical protein
LDYARLSRDGSEWRGTVDAIGITISGEPAFGARRSNAAHDLMFGGARTRTVMLSICISGEAPEAAGHSFSRHKSHGNVAEKWEQNSVGVNERASASELSKAD